MYEENDVYWIFLRRVASALIIRALNDLRGNVETYRYKTAYNFCFGIGVWESSLLLWSELADISPEKVKKIAKEIIDGKTAYIVSNDRKF